MISADDRLALINVKVERAKKHITDLDRELRVFRATKPYGVETKKDSNTGEIGLYLTRVDAIHPSIAALAGDAIQNLSTALDHLTAQLLLIKNPGALDAEFNFPFRLNSSKYVTLVQGQQKRLRQDAIDALLSVEAYKGGKGHQLWVLHRLNCLDKHRLLLTVASATGSLDLGEHFRTAAKGTFYEKYVAGFSMLVYPSVPTILKLGDKVCTLKSESDEDTKVPVHITFNEPQILEGGALLETIQHFADLVSSTILAFKPCLS